MTTPTEVTSTVQRSLDVPSLDEQTEAQQRGAGCVWCDTPLTAETAVDLGERRHRLLDGHFHTYPRGCRACTHQAANRGLQAHVAECEQCVDDVGQCETGLAWTRLMRETR
ncbi:MULTISPECIES: hypothetical protein [unclassified Streptomyces]|uniref:hypothetical protein n=1 Tax=unclassified Streptomyces TaxID=2593676 RepID=UPI001F042E39|nr:MULTISPECIES: hypothetical protein [unclassified Streptomyces]MCH0561966.1 hypothetical protein [Streptomyces sp. MUM 2J]MCH0567971.1 hypothetical protein [Streptomyces sp. MUM 136J]